MNRTLTAVAVLSAIGLAAPALGAEGTAPAPEKKAEETSRAPEKKVEASKSPERAKKGVKKAAKKVSGRKGAKTKSETPKY